MEDFADAEVAAVEVDAVVVAVSGKMRTSRATTPLQKESSSSPTLAFIIVDISIYTNPCP